MIGSKSAGEETEVKSASQTAARGQLQLSADILLQPKKLGQPCRKRMPKIGDIVMSMGGRKVGHDSKGNAKAWVLCPEQCAEILEVDADGDFRLRSPSNVESGYLFRKDFAYAVDPDSDPKEAAEDEKEAGKPNDPPFDIVVTRTGADTMGMRVDAMCPCHLEINEVTAGVIRKYNQTVGHSKQVREGFFVVGVNGKPCSREAMMAALKQAGEVSLRIAPNFEFAVVVKRTSKVGLVLLVEPLCRSLLVSKVSVGCVADYNTNAQPKRQVQENDRIIEVNGVRGDCNKMLELTCVEGGELKLVISRPVT